MNNKITLKEAVDGVLTCQRKNGHSESYLNNLRYKYNRLLKHAESLGTEHLTEELVELFMSDVNNARSGEYLHIRFLAHSRCIRFLESYLETGTVSITKLHEPIVENISDGLAEALNLYDRKETDSGLSQAFSTENTHFY